MRIRKMLGLVDAIGAVVKEEVPPSPFKDDLHKAINIISVMKMDLERILKDLHGGYLGQPQVDLERLIRNAQQALVAIESHQRIQGGDEEA